MSTMPTRSKRQIDVRVFPSFRTRVKSAWLRKVATAALAAGDPDGSSGASVVVADDETLHDLNARFRGFDELTDVLSFGATSDTSLAEEDSPDFAFPDLPDENPSLGEIVLSYPLAVRQADAHNVTTEREVALLVVHGVLHLLGHDHAEPGEEAAMKGLEERALADIFPPAPTGGARARRVR
jgi:probable rRNA maturation factor